MLYALFTAHPRHVHWQNDKWIRNLIFLRRLLSSFLKMFRLLTRTYCIVSGSDFDCFHCGNFHSCIYIQMHVHKKSKAYVVVCHGHTAQSDCIKYEWQKVSWNLFTAMIFTANQVYTVDSWSLSTLKCNSIITVHISLQTRFVRFSQFFFSFRCDGEHSFENTVF